MAEGRRMKVERACRVFGADGIEMLFQHTRKAVERICRQSALGGKRAYTVECAVQNAVSVDYEKFFHLSGPFAACHRCVHARLDIYPRTVYNCTVSGYGQHCPKICLAAGGK